MPIMEDVAGGLNTKQIEVRKPLIQHKEVTKCEESCNENQGCMGVVLLCTAVAVCGSFEFGSCVGYSAPTQAGIVNDIGLALSQLLICGGSSVAFIIGTLVTWRTLVLIGLIPCIALLAGLFFIPESPRWLAKVGHQRDFEVALQRLRGKDADISQEAAEIRENIETLQILPKARFQDLFQSKYIQSVIVGVGLMVFQQLGGINGIGFYASNVFVSAGFSSGSLGTILFGSIQVPITILGAILMDRSGRKPLIMVSATGTLIGCFATGISFYLKGQGMHAEWVPILALAGIIVYIGAYSIGMGAVPWVIMSEIFPINIKGIAGGLVTLVNWFGSWAVSYTFNFLMSWSSAGSDSTTLISTVYNWFSNIFDIP
ncbi:sugar transporter ERD6-like 16 [Cocos nucifera]|uniref:Sugar transporter ERD6-like 16 n=1 Tax=Cocos nucifera TaxID=13894 RepID=A0A8K0HW58_COCNU|nr:sugar transporter ERD6-like 16 [Cocos nucifera]